MRVFSHFLLVPAFLMTAGLSAAQGQAGSSAANPAAMQTPAADAARPAAGHRPALLRVALGASLSSSSDFPVLRTHLEYAPQFGKRLRLASRLAYSGGGDFKPYGGQFDGFGVPRSYRGLNLEQEFYWLPFGTGRQVEVGVGGGAFVGYHKATDALALAYGYDASGALQTFSYVPRREQSFHAGLITSLYADVKLDPAGRWRLGGRLSLQSGIYDVLDLNGSAPGGQLQLSRAL